jgi:hypothetical protein
MLDARHYDNAVREDNLPVKWRWGGPSFLRSYASRHGEGSRVVLIPANYSQIIFEMRHNMTLAKS